MKVLLLVQAEQRIILDRLYEGISHCCDCDIRWLNDNQQRNLRAYFKEYINIGQYDRIVFFLRFKQEIRQVNFIKSVPNLVILEHDASQNYMKGKYNGKFSKHYRKLPWVRVVCSGFNVAQRLRAEGVDAVCVPKGYDQLLLEDKNYERDIELAFIGSIKSSAYHKRKVLLETLASIEKILITRTQSGDEYVAMLNRVRFFVSADVGIGEYMIKNFEAMACGCVLLAYNQGELENNALGFIDMENIVLYETIDELISKLNLLRNSPELAEKIAEAGKKLASEEYTFEKLGAKIVKAMEAPLRTAPTPHWFTLLRNKLGI